MLKILLSAVVMISVGLTAQAQDLIVTLNGDSINGKITKIKSDFIYFTFLQRDEIRQTLLPVAKVKSHQQNYYSFSELPKTYTSTATAIHSKFRIALNAGFSQLLAKTAESVSAQNRSYITELKSGYHYGLDASYFLSKDLGFGVKLNQFKTSNSGTFYSEMSGTFLVEDNISNTFIGPSFTAQSAGADSKHTFIINAALGYLNYTNNGRSNTGVLQLSGGTLGSALDVGYDLKLFKNFALGAQASIISGVLTSYTLSNGNMSKKVNLNENERENLARLDLSLGARFNF